MRITPFIKPTVFCVTLAFSSSILADTLRDAIECAMKLNPDVRFAADHRMTTEQQLRQQKAGYLPTLDLAGGEGYQNSDNPTAAAVFNSNSVGLTRGESSLSLVQNLFTGFATKNEVRRLKDTVIAAAYKADGTAEDIALQATAQYLEILRHQKLVKLAEDNLAVHQRSKKMISERTEAGVSHAVDLTQAEGRLAQADASLIAAKGNLEDAHTTYIRIVGEPAHNLVPPVAPKASQLPSTEDKAVSKALVDHPTLKSANADVAAARAQHDTSKSTNYPRIDLVLTASRNDNLDGDPGVNNSDLAMVRGTWNLFKGGQDAARQRETAYQIQEAIDVRNRTMWEVEQSMRLSWNAWKVSQNRLSYLKEHWDLARKTVAAYRDQFKLGQRTLLDLLDSENEYYQAGVDYVTAEYTEMYARYRMLNSMGKLLGYVGVAPPIQAKVNMPNTGLNKLF